MKTAMEHLNEAFNNAPSIASSNEIYTAAINSAREEAIRECAEAAKIIRYQPDPFARTETALGSQQQDRIDKQSILNLINQIK